MKSKINFQDINVKILTVEVIAFFMIILISMYLLNRHDPFEIKGNVSYFLLFLAVITLFYGILWGLLSLVLALPFLFYFYRPFPLDYFLFNLLMVLVFGEFYYYWRRSINKEEGKRKYIEEKFNDLRKNFFFLNLSHDQMEKSYVTKPVSIRSVIKEIKKLFILGDQPYDDLLSIISNLFKIEMASLFVKNHSKGSYENVAYIGKPLTLNLNDYLVEESLREKTIKYLPSILNKEIEISSEYLAVIPIFNSDNADAYEIFVIKEIEFTEYNEENLLLIYLFFYYFFESIENVNRLDKNIQAYVKIFDIDFLIEIKKLYKIWTKLKIDSSLLVLNFKDVTPAKKIYSFMEDKIRSLDMIVSLNNNKTILILLPFTPESGCKSFINNLNSSIMDQFGKAFLSDIKEDIVMIDNDPELILSGIVKE